jgi:hypothetical protein
MESKLLAIIVAVLKADELVQRRLENQPQQSLTNFISIFALTSVQWK